MRSEPWLLSDWRISKFWVAWSPGQPWTGRQYHSSYDSAGQTWDIAGTDLQHLVSSVVHPKLHFNPYSEVQKFKLNSSNYYIACTYTINYKAKGG
jgi:hypothetical protein